MYVEDEWGLSGAPIGDIDAWVNANDEMTV